MNLRGIGAVAVQEIVQALLQEIMPYHRRNLLSQKPRIAGWSRKILLSCDRCEITHHKFLKKEVMQNSCSPHNLDGDLEFRFLFHQI